jgi:hypothetical protein
MASLLSRHFGLVRQALLGLPDSRNVFVFGASCVERFWPVYDRAAHSRSWDRRAPIRSVIDSVWTTLASDVRPTELTMEGNLIEIEWIETGADNAAFTFVNSLENLVTALLTGDAKGVYLSGQSNLDSAVRTRASDRARSAARGAL